MTERRADLLLHPVRIRIVQATAGRELTTKQLAAELPEVPQSSLYRHVRILVETGVLEVVSTRPVRGTVERTYAVNTDAASLSPDEVGALDPEEHLEYFAGFVGSVLERATAYLRSPDADPTEDGFGYRINPLWLSDEEAERFQEALHEVVHEFAHNEPTPDRRRRVLSTILIPDAPADPPDGA